MLEYLGQAPDLEALVLRAQQDFDEGRTALALLRLEAAKGHFRDDGRVLYAEGLIRRDGVGQTEQARGLFETAYDAARRGRGTKTTTWFSACNAATLAPDWASFSRWAKIADGCRPRGNPSELTGQLAAKKQGAPYSDYLSQAYAHHEELRHFGPAACAAQLLLACTDLASQEDRLALHMSRGLCLRQLDIQEEQRRAFDGEAFVSGDRLALDDAAREMEVVVQLDPHNAEAWNFLAAWRILLGKLDQAIAAADRAIALRPHHYAKPHTNKALALKHLGRIEEANASARRALEIAHSAGHSGEGVAQDIDIANRLIGDTSGPPSAPSVQNWTEFFAHVMRATKMRADEHAKLAKCSFTDLAQQLKKRCDALGQRPSRDLVPIVADLLMFFSPQLAVFAMTAFATMNANGFHRLAEACLFLAANCSGAQARDARRVVALLVMAERTPSGVKENYRRTVLAPAKAASGAMAKLHERMREEFSLFSPRLPDFLDDQPALAPQELDAARTGLLRRLGDG